MLFIFKTNISLLHRWVNSKDLVRVVSLAAWLSTRNENYAFHSHAKWNTLVARITESALYQDRQHCRKLADAFLCRWHSQLQMLELMNTNRGEQESSNSDKKVFLEKRLFSIFFLKKNHKGALLVITS